MRFGFVLRELEQVERALDVDLVRGHRRELGSCREQRREMEDELDLELRQDALEHGAVEDRAGDLALHLRRERGIERADVERDDGAIRLRGEPVDQAVADLAAAPVMRTTGFRTADYSIAVRPGR